jgi:hypothetical protein
MPAITPLRLIQLLAEAVNKNPGLANQPVQFMADTPFDAKPIVRCYASATDETIYLMTR